MRMLKRASRQVTRWPEHGCGAWFSGDFHVISISPNLNYQQLNNLVICGGRLLAKFKLIYFQNFIFCPISGQLSPRAQVQDFPHRHSLCSLHVSPPLYKIILFFFYYIIMFSAPSCLSSSEGFSLLEHPLELVPDPFDPSLSKILQRFSSECNTPHYTYLLFSIEYYTINSMCNTNNIKLPPLLWNLDNVFQDFWSIFAVKVVVIDWV